MEDMVLVAVALVEEVGMGQVVKMVVDTGEVDEVVQAMVVKFLEDPVKENFGLLMNQK